MYIAYMQRGVVLIALAIRHKATHPAIAHLA